MRHGDKNNNLSRTASHRKALLSNLACQLFLHKKIVTTLAKAKALRPYAEPLLTKAKENTTHQRRLVFSQLQDKGAIQELFDVISLKIASRPGGYTRIIKLGKRPGDAAETAMIELVDYNDIYGKGKDTGEETTTKRTRRAGGSRKKAVAQAPAAEVPIIEENKDMTVAPQESNTIDIEGKGAEWEEKKEDQLPPAQPTGIETPEEDATK